MRIDGLRADYRYRRSQAPSGRRVAEKAIETHRELANKPGLLLKAKTLDLHGATVGFVHTDARPQYRLFMSDLDLNVKNFSNHLREGTADAELRGLFMGSGATGATATFRPETEGPDFDLLVGIDDTDMRTMNEVLRAHGKFDVVSGFFSLYAELHVRKGWVTGWVKPLFRHVKAYSPETDEHKPLGERLREHLVDLANKILKNRPRQEVGTRATIEGPLPDPKASTLEVLAHLIENAFFKAIFPGFENEVKGRRVAASTKQARP